MINAPCLHLPDLTQPFYVYSDASGKSLGAVLCQKDESGEHPVAFASRKLKDCETRYSVFEREALGVVFAISQFSVYLLGKHFTVYCDQASLSKVLKLKDPTSRVARWMLSLQQYSFDIIHVSSAKNKVADCLSRVETANTEVVVGPLPKDLVIKSQNNDKFCKEIKDKICNVKSNFFSYQHFSYIHR